MTEGELCIFFETLASLFPTKLNDEQVKVWASRVRALPATEAASSLNDYYSCPKSPSDGPQPSLTGFLRCVRGKRQDNTAGRTDPEFLKIQKWTAEARASLLKDSSYKADDVRSWPTERLWERFSAWEFKKLCWLMSDQPMKESIATNVSHRSPVDRYTQDSRRVVYGQWKVWAQRVGETIPDFNVAVEMAMNEEMSLQ